MSEVDVLPYVVRRARRLIDDDEYTAACRLLAQGLAGIDPVTAVADRRLIDAALVYLSGLSFLDCVTGRADMQLPGHADIELAWARYAETAARACYGEHDPRWQHNATMYAWVCADQGLTFDAVSMHRRKVLAYQQHSHQQVPLARRDLATALHANGQCAEAIVSTRKSCEGHADGRRGRVAAPGWACWCGGQPGCGGGEGGCVQVRRSSGSAFQGRKRSSSGPVRGLLLLRPQASR